MTTPARPPLMIIAEPVPAPPRPAGPPERGWPLLRLGFRPFYLLSCAGAALLPLLWLAQLYGLPVGAPALPGLGWHGHEMVFGVVVAVVIGFLFTAGRNWTGLDTPRGPLLGALALLWLAARVAGWSGPAALFVALDLALLPLAAAIFARLLLKARNGRNAPLAIALAALATLNALFHAAQAGWLAVAPRRVLEAALLVLLAVASIVAGRVIPNFTGNALPASRPRVRPRLEQAVALATALVPLAWLVAPGSPLTAALLAAVALLHAARAFGWQPWLTRRVPILWVLHAAYAALPLGLALLAAAAAGVVPATAGLHLLATGALGGLMVGMMSRTSRGHTGRPLHAGRREVAAYALVLLGALLRAGAAFEPALLPVAGLAWCGGFALLFSVLLPWLVRARADGRPG